MVPIPKTSRLLWLHCFLVYIVESVVYNTAPQIGDPSINKVRFTQIGYIQFLKYIADVPPLTDYTFCIWLRSLNLNHSQPILSYSKHEEERLIRFWLSPHGTHINLAILEEPLFHIPIQFLENHWYHLCQSWSSYQAAWSFYLNGKLTSSGHYPKMRNVRIKGGGDLVIGQEYTDFDKGLDDGIEGDVFGFNFVLSSTLPAKAFRRHSNIDRTTSPHPSSTPYEYVLPYNPAQDVPAVLAHFPQAPYRKGKGLLDVFDKMFGFLDQGYAPRPNRKIIHDIDEVAIKSVGQRLVDLSFHCHLGRGAPLHGKQVLISWTKTPVRVFGGAILKNIQPFCIT